jgi:TatD DNase family protein
MSDDTFYTIDIGVNFAGRSYTPQKVAAILEESYTAGVAKIISISNSLREIPANARLAKTHCQLYYTAGVHPHDARSITDLKQLQTIEKHVADPKMVAVGEIGLDYNRMFTPKDKQIAVFEAQIDIAIKHGKPMYLHCRDAFDDFYTILMRKGYFRGVVHCFTGNKQEAKKLLDLGFHFGITGWLCDTRRNKDLAEAVRTIPVERLMVETDAPWLSIEKGRPSHPTDTGAIVQEIAWLKKMDPIALGNAVYANTIEFFGL